MLKKRVIPVLLVDSDRLVKTVAFSNKRDVGYPITVARVYESQQADELVILNINKDLASFYSYLSWVKKISQEFCAPISAGGGVRSFDHAKLLFENGADKVVINTANYNDLSILEQVSKVYGSQAAVAGIDVRYIDDEYILHSFGGSFRESKALIEHIQCCEKSGAGEYFVQSIDRDGKMAGLDIQLASIVTASTKKPVVLAGGAGSYVHLEEVFKNTSISGVGCASIFHFSDSNPLRACAYLANAGIDIKKV